MKSICHTMIPSPPLSTFSAHSPNTAVRVKRPRRPIHAEPTKLTKETTPNKAFPVSRTKSTRKRRHHQLQVAKRFPPRQREEESTSKSESINFESPRFLPTSSVEITSHTSSRNKTSTMRTSPSQTLSRMGYRRGRASGHVDWRLAGLAWLACLHNLHVYFLVDE